MIHNLSLKFGRQLLVEREIFNDQVKVGAQVVFKMVQNLGLEFKRELVSRIFVLLLNFENPSIDFIQIFFHSTPMRVVQACYQFVYTVHNCCHNQDLTKFQEHNEPHFSYRITIVSSITNRCKHSPNKKD